MTRDEITKLEAMIPGLKIRFEPVNGEILG